MFLVEGRRPFFMNLAWNRKFFKKNYFSSMLLIKKIKIYSDICLALLAKLPLLLSFYFFLAFRAMNSDFRVSLSF